MVFRAQTTNLYFIEIKQESRKEIQLMLSLSACSTKWLLKMSSSLRARLQETRSELRPVWNLKTLSKVILFTWQFHCKQPWNLKPLSKIVLFPWRFYCGNFPNHCKNLLHMCKWYLLINVSLTDAKQMLRYWLVFQQQ